MNNKNTIKKAFLPGSKWLYFKIYTGIKTADTILSSHLYPLICKMKKANLIDKWFFIRYNDPDFHIRFRLLLKEEKYSANVISLVYFNLEKLVCKKILWKLQICTYRRESERYGLELIEFAETIFCLNSECIISILKKIDKLQDENYRWMIALKLIDTQLSDFSINLISKQKITNLICKSLKKEFGFNDYNSKQLNMKFKNSKQIIENILSNSFDDRNFDNLCIPIKKQSKELVKIAAELNSILSSTKSIYSIENLSESYLHMMLNRLFQSKNRLHELILYFYLQKYYLSEIVKNKK